MKKAQTSYSPETLSKLYEKLLKTPSRKMSEPSGKREVNTRTKKFKLGGKADITKGDRDKLPKDLKEKMVKSSKSPGGEKITPKEKAKMKKGGCVGPKYMCGGKKKKMK